MESDKKEKLNAAEQKCIMKAVYTFFNQNETINGELNFESLEKEGASFGLFSEPGAVYLSKDILGGFKSMVPFMLQHRAQPKTDSAIMTMMEVMDSVSEWVSETKVPILTGGRVIEKIEAVTAPYLFGVEESGSLTYAVGYNLIYRKEG